MRTLKTETKTFYYVELTETDMLDAITAYRDAQASNDSYLIGKDEAFCNNKPLSDLSDGAIADLAYAHVKRWVVYGGAAECDWLAHYLGYDGWDNSGYTHTSNITNDISIRLTFWNY